MQHSLVSHAHDFCPSMSTCHAEQVEGEEELAQVHVVLHDVPECSTAFFFFCALPPTVAPAAEVTGAAAGAVG